MTAQGDDRRRHLRAQPPGVRGTLHSPGDVEVIDLSLSGLQLETFEELSPGERCFLELRHRHQTASVEVEVRWASAYRVARTDDSLRPVFRAGGCFLDVFTEGTDGILDWLLVAPPPNRPVAAAPAPPVRPTPAPGRAG